MAYEVLGELRKQHGPKYEQLLAKVEELPKLLPDFFDVNAGNMFYDEATNKLVLYDMSEQ